MPDEQQLSLMFSCLADPTRRRILQILTGNPLPISQVAQECGLSIASASKHLKLLENACLIRKEHVGKQVFVETKVKILKLLELYLKQFTRFDDARLAKMAAVLKAHTSRRG